MYCKNYYIIIYASFVDRVVYLPIYNITNSGTLCDCTFSFCKLKYVFNNYLPIGTFGFAKNGFHTIL